MNKEAFNVDETLSNVFDSMVNRAVPMYAEVQRMMAELAADHAVEGSDVYDLGCSTGNSMIGLNMSVDPSIKFIGIDESEEELEKCKSKLLELRCFDLNKGVKISNASVVVMSLTLQFVRPINREKLLRSIYEGLNSGGVLILVEEILAEEDRFNREFLNYYYNYKRRNNFSEQEISQKRAALENVLVPYKLSENITLLKETGFSHCELFFKWYNFAGLIATKD
jgi:tRNA (cmo5U34)-methyltransferase